jgi:hypothetical protein
MTAGEAAQVERGHFGGAGSTRRPAIEAPHDQAHALAGHIEDRVRRATGGDQARD